MMAKRWTRQDDFDASVQQASGAHRVAVALIKAVIGVESGFDPLAYNPNDPGGAYGLMQMIPTTARALGYSGPMDALRTNPALAIDLGTTLLAQNLQRTGGAVADSVSAYNGGFRPALGFGSVRADGTYANQAYVSRVLDTANYFAAYEASKSPQQLPDVVVTAGGEGATPVPFRPSSGGDSPGRGLHWKIPLAGLIGGGLLWLLIALGLF